MPPKRGIPTRGAASGRGAAKPAESTGRPQAAGQAGAVAPQRGTGARPRATPFKQGAAARGKGTVTPSRGRGAGRGGKPPVSTRVSLAKSAAKSAAVPAAGGKQAEAPAKKAWTERDEAARKIQCMVRGRLARKKKEQLKKERIDYEAEIEKIQREVSDGVRGSIWIANLSSQ